MINRTHVRQFLAVVDAGNFTRAAIQLNVAQPTLSAGITELERRLATKLFIRERKRIRLTEAGNRFLPIARSIEREFNLAEKQISNSPVPPRPVKLGIAESLSAQFLEQGLSFYDGADPIELVEGSTSELSAALSSGAIDLAIVNLSRFANRYECIELFEETYGLAVPKSHKLSNSDSVKVTEIADETMIARRSCEFLNQTSQFFTSNGVRPRFSFRSHDEERVMAMVRAGIGITVAPKSYSSARVAIVQIDGLMISRKVGFVLGRHWRLRTNAIEAVVSAWSSNIRILDVN